MQVYHNAVVDSPQIKNFLSMFERPKQAASGTCSLCLREAENVKPHLAHHLEQVALFAIPRENEMPDMDSGANAKGSRGSTSKVQSSLEFGSPQSQSDLDIQEDNELQRNALSTRIMPKEVATQQIESLDEEHSIDPDIISRRPDQ